MTPAEARPAQARPAEARRIVVKTGSSLVVTAESGEPHRAWIASLAEDIAGLRAKGREIILVSSGAVALGRRALGLGLPLRLEQKQAAAAAGQIALMQAWQEGFAAQGITVAQLLLTIDDSEHRRRYLNARSTFETLLTCGALPIVNENDTVATAEIRVGDNDRLAARVAQMAGADRLILLSDIDGLYTADPGHDPAARHIPQVEVIDESIRAMAGAARSEVGTGGMATKIAAAEIATQAGCTTVIARGNILHPLRALEEGTRATVFLAHTTPRGARKDWIAGALAPQGEFVVDAGAEKALRAGNSLLPAGVRGVGGQFQRGDAVWVKTATGAIAKGLSAYHSDDARKIAGRNSREIEAILGFKGRDELIHRDDMVML